MSDNKKRLSLSLFILCLTIGLLLSVDLTDAGYAGYLEKQDQEDLLAIWRDLNDKQDNLGEELETVRQHKADLSQEANDADSLANIQEQLTTLLEVNGSLPVKGPGVEVEFSGETPLLYLDLVDLVNELWSSGAEGISVNNQRVTAETSFYFKETDSGIFLTVNGQPLKYPVVIKAVGNPNMLEKGLTFPGGIVDNLSTLYNIKPSIKKKDSLELPKKVNPSGRLMPGWITGDILSGEK